MNDNFGGIPIKSEYKAKLRNKHVVKFEPKKVKKKRKLKRNTEKQLV